MRKRRIRFSEGDVFLIPLNQGGFAAALIARRDVKGSGVLAYIFKRTVDEIQTFDMGCVVSREMVSDVVDVGVQSLRSGDWPIVGRLPSWNRSDWPVPVFRDRGGQLSIRSQDDYREEIGAGRDSNDKNIFRYVVYGHSALESRLSQRFSEEENERDWREK